MTMKIRLRDYQRGFCRACEDALTLGVGDGGRVKVSRVLGVAATGGGKTAMASAMIWMRVVKSRQRALFLAHTDELCDQAVGALARNSGLIPALEKADSFAPKGAEVVVGSVATMAQPNRLARWPQDHFGLVVADEAHLSMADGYNSILQHFNAGGAHILGITATPERSDKLSLMRFYEHVAAEVPLKLLIDRGYLAPIVVQTAQVEIPIECRVTNAAESDSLASAIEPYYRAIIDQIDRYAQDRRRILIFHPSRKASRQFNSLMVERGYASEHVDGTSPDREEVIKRFSVGETRVLNNVMLMTAGVDIPAIDCVIMLRPTKSRTTYIQAVGRGTRLYCPHGCHLTGAMCQHPDRKAEMLLLDFLWQFKEKNVMGPADIFADDPETREAARDVLRRNDERQDLFEVDLRAQHEREARLIKALEAAAKRRAVRFDARNFAAVMGQPELIDYEPMAEWETRPITPNQQALLEKWRMKPGEITTMGHASALITVGLERFDRGLATPGQVLQLMRFGVPNPHNVTFDDASRILEDCFRNTTPHPYATR